MSQIPGVFATRFEPSGPAVGTAVVLPGRAYPPVAPLLFFATQVLLQHGWAVRHVWWDPPQHETPEETIAWVGGHLAEATADVSGRVLAVGKSLGTWSASLAADRSYDGIWLTPLLTYPETVDAITRNPAHQLLVGGVADDLWDPEVAADLAQRGCDVLEIPDADHALLVPGDIVRGAQIQVEVTSAIDRFLAGLSA